MCTVRSSSGLLGGCLLWGVCLSRVGVFPRGLSAWGEGFVCLRGLPGGVCSGGVCIPACTGADRMTDRCKNITFPQLRLRTVILSHLCENQSWICCKKVIKFGFLVVFNSIFFKFWYTLPNIWPSDKNDSHLWKSVSICCPNDGLKTCFR